MQASRQFHLITDNLKYDFKDFEVVRESATPGGEKRLYIAGPYTVANSRNRNQRIYPLDEMVRQIDIFDKELIQSHRAYGELEHPDYPQIMVTEACHLITEIKQDGNVFYGKSKILSTPKGKIVEALLSDGGGLGISSRALGSVNEDGIVEEFKLCTFDIVADPSCQTAFVNGILESKTWSCNYDPRNEAVYESFEKSLAKMPRLEREKYIRESIVKFMAELGKGSR